MRTFVITVDGFQRYREAYVHWLLEQCCGESACVEGVSESEAASPRYPTMDFVFQFLGAPAGRCPSK